MTVTEPTSTRDVSGPTGDIAAFATGISPGQIPDKARDHAKLIVLDTLGVCLAALDFPIGRIVTEYVDDLGGRPVASVIGTDVMVSAPMAALANGTLAHGLDFDDHKHLSTHTLPAALAVGEQLGSSGRHVLDAYIIGREVGARLGGIIEAKRKLKKGPTYRGWYRVGVVGPIASAVSAGTLLELSTEQMANAIGIAASSSAGLRRNQGTMTKALHAGNAASDGVHAALLASRGFTGDVDILEAPLGLVNAICLPGESDWAPVGLLGSPFEIEGKLAAKRFPSCSPSHMPIAAALAIRAKHHVDPDDIASVEADLHTFSLLRTDPQEAIATGYSLPYLLASALVDGELGLDQVGEDRLHDPRIRALMAKVVHDSEAAPAGGPERVTVRLLDGTVLTEEIDGKPDLRDADAILEKYAVCAGRRLAEADVTALRLAVAGIDEIADISELLNLVKPDEG
jgi:2-methylcitrate dehydratase PrpD